MSDQTPVPPRAPTAPPSPPYADPAAAGAPYPGPPRPAHPNTYPASPVPPYPGAQPPAGGYDVSGYHPATGSSPASRAKRAGGLGLVALLLSLVAAVVVPIVGAVAAFQVGAGTGSRFETMTDAQWTDLSLLSPVREWVLLGEVAFWAGTVLGVWAIVQGIVAAVKGRGRGTGIAAIVVGVVALFLFGTVVYAGAVAGVVIGA